MTEDQARLTRVCPNCGKAKELGMVVCWDCFKYIPGCYKDSPLSFEQWLASQAKEKQS